MSGWMIVWYAATGYLYASWLAGVVVDVHFRRKRQHRWGPESAGTNWRVLVLPLYVRWVRDFHDRVDGRDKVRTPVVTYRRTRCPVCGMPHDLTPDGLAVRFCERMAGRGE
jgi:hypothetical protein